MSEFIVDEEGREGIFGVFEDDGKAGYLYIYEPNGRGILGHLHIYDRDRRTIVNENDVAVMWSTDHRKCGVSIAGRMRGIIDASDPEMASTIGKASDSIDDSKWLQGFEDYFDRSSLLRARQRYWKEMLQRTDPKAKILPDSQTPPETNFVAAARCTNTNIFGVFEDDGETAYLYLYDRVEEKILNHVHVYDRSKALKVAPSDVQVMWSNDGTKCGVVIWNKMRAIIDRVKNQPGRVKLENRQSPGIGDAAWLKGFEHKPPPPKHRVKFALEEKDCLEMSMAKSCVSTGT